MTAYNTAFEFEDAGVNGLGSNMASGLMKFELRKLDDVYSAALFGSPAPRKCAR